MFQRIRTGWQLTKASLKVLNQDKELLVYPIMSMFLVLTIAVLFFFLALVSGIITALSAGSLTELTLYLYLALFLIASYAVAIFFEGAVISSVLQRLEGKNPTISSGLQAPLKHIHQIIFWALILTVVTVAIQLIRNLGRGKSRGAEAASNLGASAIETAWNLLSFFAIPAIIIENHSVFPALARSKELFVKSWGENITAQFATGVLFVLLAFVGAIPLIIAFLIGNTTFLIIIATLFALWIIALIIISTTVKGILIAFLYAYATNHKIPKEYGITPQMMISQG